MANQLKITKQYSSGSWLVTSEVHVDSDADFPREVFLWTLDRQGALSAFQAIGHIDQVTRYPLYDPNRTSNFGIHLVRSDSSRQELSSEDLADECILVLKKAFDLLLVGYDDASKPVEEIYPAQTHA